MPIDTNADKPIEQTPQSTKPNPSGNKYWWIYALIAFGFFFFLRDCNFPGAEATVPTLAPTPIVYTVPPLAPPSAPAPVPLPAVIPAPTFSKTPEIPAPTRVIDPNYELFDDPASQFSIEYPKGWKLADDQTENCSISKIISGTVEMDSPPAEVTISLHYYARSPYRDMLQTFRPPFNRTTPEKENVYLNGITYSTFIQNWNYQFTRFYICDLSPDVVVIGFSMNSLQSPKNKEAVQVQSEHMIGSITYNNQPAKDNPVATPTSGSTPSPSPTSIPIPERINAITPTSTITEIYSTLDPLKDLELSSELITMKYEWTYLSRPWTWELAIPKGIYDYYKALPRSPTRDYSIYVTHPWDDDYINQLVSKFRECARQEGYDEFQTMSFMAAFVQSLPYTNDLITAGYDEYPRYPIETLIDNGGDCEDTAILMASLVRALNYGAVLLIFPETAQTPGHCAVGIKCGPGVYGPSWAYNGDKYYYLETTGTGWEIGETPVEYSYSPARVYPLIPVPILTHSWKYDGTTRQIELRVIVDNLGSADAPGVYVNAGFDAGNGRWWNSKESSPADIQVDGSVTYTMFLTPPEGVYTRLMVKVVYNGYTADSSLGKQFYTD